MADLKPKGVCVFCNKELTQAGITRHLNAHLLGLQKVRPVGKGKSYHLWIEPDSSWGATPYFLNVLVDGAQIFEQLDNFLREIWLECCGHMSAFTNVKSRHRGGGGMMEETDGKIPESNSFESELYEGLKLRYEYDFGSSTELQIIVLKELPYAANGIELLSRNEPLKIMCDACGKKPAQVLCSVCAGYEDEAFFCKDCAKKHKKTCDDFADYARMPVVNSPRLGICAYKGGVIDIKRDKPYQLSE